MKFLAQNLTLPDTTRGGVKIQGPLNAENFGGAINITSIIGKAIPYVFAIAGIGLLLMILSAGFTLLTSAGDAKKMETGKNALTNAIVGFLIVFVAYWIVQFFGIAFGLTEIQTIFK